MQTGWCRRRERGLPGAASRPAQSRFRCNVPCALAMAATVVISAANIALVARLDSLSDLIVLASLSKWVGRGEFDPVRAHLRGNPQGAKNTLLGRSAQDGGDGRTMPAGHNVNRATEGGGHVESPVGRVATLTRLVAFVKQESSMGTPTLRQRAGRV